MSRISYSDDEERPGQFALWDANCLRSIRGRVGQRELRELEAALLALPEKALIHGSLTNEDGDVCAIACYAKHKGIDIEQFDPEYESDEVGIAAGMPRLVAWKVVALNDIENESHWVRAEGPSQDHYAYRTPHLGWSPYSIRVPYTPEERYETVLAWVRANLTPPRVEESQKR
jgi:hypothetical protein